MAKTEMTMLLDGFFSECPRNGEGGFSGRVVYHVHALNALTTGFISAVLVPPGGGGIRVYVCLVCLWGNEVDRGGYRDGREGVIGLRCGPW